jgi:thymidylate kinase
MVTPFLEYLARPDLTVYLHTDASELLDRANMRPDRQGSGRPEMTLDRLRRLQDHFDEVAANDPSAGHVHTDGLPPEEVAAAVVAMLPSPSTQVPPA